MIQDKWHEFANNGRLKTKKMIRKKKQIEKKNLGDNVLLYLKEILVKKVSFIKKFKEEYFVLHSAI